MRYYAVSYKNESIGLLIIQVIIPWILSNVIEYISYLIYISKN